MLFALLLLIFRFALGRLGADPVRTLLLATGDWTMRFLLLTLTITPLVELSGWKSFIFLRRLFGIYSLLYAGLHFLVYLGLDYLFNIRIILEEAVRTPFIIIGFGSFLLLIPLGITSIRPFMARMENRTWVVIHGLVYLIALGGVVHYLLKLKVISKEFVVYTVLLSLLLLLAFASLSAGLYRIWRRVGAGRPVERGEERDRVTPLGPINLSAFLQRGVLASRLFGRPVSGTAHALVLFGSMVLILGHAVYPLSFLGVSIFE